METFTLPVLDSQGKEIESLKLDPSVFDGTVNSDAIHQAITAYRANQRLGLASTKTRGEVSGGGRKPWRQKGTGRARVGSIRSPLWRHGGVIFGPHPRDFSYSIPKKIKALALKSALCAKLKENRVVVLDKLNIDKPKTKEVVKIFTNLKLSKDNLLLLLDKIDANLQLALRNINHLSVNLAKWTNTYEVLSAQKLVITKAGIKDLTERLKHNK